MKSDNVTILAIESSCDDTSAAVLKDGKMLANIIANQEVHTEWGGVVPELASRAHQQNIVPVVDMALKKAGIEKQNIDVVAFTKGPGLIGSLLVGASFAKAFALGLGKPIIGVHHMRAHVLAHFIDEPKPAFPFLCLTVSGGHTQIVLVKDALDMEVLGSTRDDAAGEAFDKTAKLLGLPYPGGPEMDKLAKKGDKHRFTFTEPKVDGLDFSFSGLKTAVVNFVHKNRQKNPHFVKENLYDLCASVQHTIVQILLKKFLRAAEEQHITQLAIAGGVSANSELRQQLTLLEQEGYTVFLPDFQYCIDNAAMIAMCAYFQYQKGDFETQDAEPTARWAL
ncbi:MAG: tRNA (adenosine(37)-N6)-threonylcarbamoyltransferase complex transferase subunit TsaD [Chitinophagales bacterium]